MPRPRQVLAGNFYLITRRCAQRMFLLRPDAVTRNAFIYCLAIAAKLVGIDVIATCAMSNHHHTVIYDRFGLFPKFIEHFHKLLARSQNALRGRSENFWAARQCSVVRLVDRAAVMKEIVYCLSNPVKDMLVAKVHQWPGANSFVAMRRREPLAATRPLHFFLANGKMEATATLTLAIPDVLGSADDVIREIEAGVLAVEEQCATERAKTGASVLGVRAVKKQSWRATAASDEPRNKLSPTIACRDLEERSIALHELREFFAAYRIARQVWLTGHPVTFPPGTYALKRFSALPPS
jgi:putative transposase